MLANKDSRKRLLLISNSTLYGGTYLDHAEDEIRDFLRGVRRVLFIPFALHDRDEYADLARQRFKAMGYDLTSAHEVADARQAVRDAEVVFIGGGNTFRLLKTLYDLDLLLPIRDRVAEGMLYVGSSAGANVACPTLKTTNDMPIVQPPSFEALDLVPFQINPHYLDPDPDSTHMGETREKRIMQFHEENATPVVGLREGAMLRVEQSAVALKGRSGVRVFRRGQEPVEVEPGAMLTDLVSPGGQREA